MGTANEKTSRTRTEGLDELDRRTRTKLKNCLATREHLDSAWGLMAALPRKDVVRSMLEAAHKDAGKSFDAILDQERVRAKRAARRWARNVLDDPAAVILDSETTGLSSPIDFVEISVIDREGNTLFDSRVRPVAYVERPLEKLRRREDGTYDERISGERVRRPPITTESGALRVHGITADDLRAAPSFPMIYSELLQVLDGKNVVVYNAPYDAGVWRQAVERYRLQEGGVDPESWRCAMRAYAAYAGEYRHETDQYRQTNPVPASFRWQRLGGGHRALEDCRHALKLICKMAGREAPEFGELPAVSPVPLRVLYAPPRPVYDEEDFSDIPFRAIFPRCVREQVIL